MRLTIKNSTSRGQYTYGYFITRLSDSQTGGHFKTVGGGYSLVGVVLAEWLSTTYQSRLLSARDKDGRSDLYGFRVSGDGGVKLEGTAGTDSMIKIGAAIGLEITRVTDQKDNLIGFDVVDNGFSNH